MKTKKSIVIEFCIQNDITEKQYYGKEKVGGSLYLGGLTSIPEDSILLSVVISTFVA